MPRARTTRSAIAAVVCGALMFVAGFANRHLVPRVRRGSSYEAIAALSLVALLMLAAGALAARSPTARERAAIIRAVGARSCEVGRIRVSTINRNWALFAFGRAPGANNLICPNVPTGAAFVKHVAPQRWREAAIGSDITCDQHGLPPLRVQRDLGLTCRVVHAARAASVVLGSSTDGGGADGVDAGFGRTKPARIWFGGDLSTVFFALRWRGWGASAAEASGRTYLTPSYAHSAPARVVAYDLGRCHGQLAYLRIRLAKGAHGRLSGGMRLCQ
jgi:hypothetical protein